MRVTGNKGDAEQRRNRTPFKSARFVGREDDGLSMSASSAKPRFMQMTPKLSCNRIARHIPCEVINLDPQERIFHKYRHGSPFAGSEKGY